jgi:hypothetical protein
MRNDEAAYTAAMTDVLKQSAKIKLDKVDNIKVNGDAATADVTLSFTLGTQPPENVTTTAHLVREGGQWKDCTPTQGAG